MLEEKIKDYDLVTRHIVNYGDCNQLENLFGGTLLAWIDEAASIYCRKTMDTPIVVTKTIDSMEFHTPTKLGETICLYCKNNKVGTTSLTIDILVTNKGYEGRKEREIATTTMVWVSLCTDGKPFAWRKAKDARQAEDV